MDLTGKLFGSKAQETAQTATDADQTSAQNASQMPQQDKAGSTVINVYHLIVLDESGSMQCVTHQTITGCNETIQSIRAMQKANQDTQRHFVSIYLFDSQHSRYIIQNKIIDEVREITPKDYCPNACTPLFDALGSTLTDMQRLMNQDNTLGYVTIITDGYENASREYTLNGVRILINALKEKNVIFSFIGANIDAEEYAKSLNIDNVMQFIQDEEGMKQMWAKERRGKMRSMARMSFGCAFDDSFKLKNFACESNSDYYKDDVDESRIADERITELKENEVLVFGSNARGIHNAGAAALALAQFGAKMGQAEGLQGQSYAIPVNGVSKQELKDAVQRFCTFAAEHPELTFLITTAGCETVGWTAYDVAPMFQQATPLKNVKFPRAFCDFLFFN